MAVMTVNDRIRALSKLPKFGPLPQELPQPHLRKSVA